MPSGVETFVDGEGFAIVDFVDPKLRGPGLAKLIAIGGPESVETITRDGPRRKYRVPEGNASAAGLIDNLVDATAHGDQKFAEALKAADPVAQRSASGRGLATGHPPRRRPRDTELARFEGMTSSR